MIAMPDDSAPLRRIADDFEYRAPTREHGLEVVSGYFIDLDRGEDWYITEFGPEPPFPTDESTAFVSFAVDADLRCFRALGWEMPSRVVCIHAEFRRASVIVEEPEL